MNGKELMDRCFEIDVRIEKILHLPVMVLDMDTEFFYFLTEECNKILSELLGVEDISEVTDQYGTERDAQREALQEAVVWKLPNTWLVQAATPVKEARPSGGYVFSWGYYTTQWFAADSYDEALTQAIDWAEADQEKTRAESKALGKQET